ncbi:MAG: AMP-binding protein [Reyranella sp.]|nr:AMP-binding protein [Reyranella sp.]
MPLDLDGPSVAFTPFDPSWVERPALELFAKAASTFADRVACEDAAGQLTYGEIWRACCRLAARIEAAVPPGRAVGVLLPNEAAYPVAVLACLAAARPCIMIDRHHPPDRVAAIVRDAGLGAAIMRQDEIDRGLLLPAGTAVIALDEALAGALEGAAGKAVGHDSHVAPPATVPLAPAAAAFVVYTSGSTGRPKGIALSQRAVLHRASELINAVHLRPDDKVLSLASPSTIGGLQQIFEVMLSGASLVKLDLQRVGLGPVVRAVEDRRLTMMFSTPAVWRSVSRLADARRAFASLRCVQTSGDALLAIDLEQMRRVLPADCRILSVYGATEAPALVQWFVPAEPPVEDARVPAGYALAGIDLAVVDEAGRPVACGEAGELVVRSPWTSAGVWRAGALHPGPFEVDPAGSDLPVYRTGDLVRQRGDGLFVTLGRRDRQIKILGNRVEPAEIETQLRRAPGVAEAAVLARRFDLEPRILAFVVPDGDTPAGLASALRDRLAATLPAYMRPAEIHLLSALPLLPGRKVDEDALLAHAARRDRIAEPLAAPAAPASRRGAEMVDTAWRAALGRPPQGRHSFEESGGDSLRLLQLVFDLEQLCGRSLPMERFDGRMTVEQLAHALDGCLTLPRETLASDQPAIFLFPPGGGGDSYLAAFRAACLRQFDIRQIGYPDLATLAGRAASFEAIAAHAVGQVVALRPVGPLVFAGYSDGGDVAFEAARRLRDAGREVALLLVLDTDVTGRTYEAAPARRPSFADEIRRYGRGLRRRDWPRLVQTLLSAGFFASPAGRALVRAVVGLNPPLPRSVIFVARLHATMRLFAHHHACWLGAGGHPRLDVPTVLLRSQENRPGAPEDLGWHGRTSRLSIVAVPGDHSTMLTGQAGEELSERFARLVLQAHHKSTAVPPTG